MHSSLIVVCIAKSGFIFYKRMPFKISNTKLKSLYYRHGILLESTLLSDHEIVQVPVMKLIRFLCLRFRSAAEIVIIIKYL